MDRRPVSEAPAYQGEPFKMMVTDTVTGKRVVAFWTRSHEAEAMRQLREHPDRPKWTEPRYLNVINRRTGV